MKRLILIFLLLAGPVFAVQPSEILSDPALESRAREISAGLRCPVCQNESIDESNAPISHELRVLLRERLVAGDTDEQVVDFLVARFGEFILLNPDRQGANLILWAAAPAMLLIALLVGWLTIRRRVPAEQQLTEAEQAELERILHS
ncbi:MAG: cytochrome c-type biogenesis protein CcmH [Loktanella salsilacus]|jgi:cytochrome c-type biogenesis protein CcmH|uniref:cytochrome c-type biogenesis protein n=1 Tax=Loktanella salsilacus TaxID=195913 RepID=UPI0020B7765C|nr:cytochrome c-type biogenesis protein [Loktanella salsilacus]UTH45568.1 cytochrome c-type biogenesis protein CcmH [Loktanella salsilacus]|tara:strand:- start:421 stop:861 length:441 start_codon:yes stop_codon:yes gene_type:complete